MSLRTLLIYAIAAVVGAAAALIVKSLRDRNRPRNYAAEVAKCRKDSGASLDTHAIIHMPPTGCPSGYTRVEGLFQLEDGQRYDGCIRDRGSPTLTIDFLLPGERLPLPLSPMTAPVRRQ